jgi:hypothetical protein
MRTNETCEKTLLEKIQNLEKKIQLVIVKKKEVVEQRET